jgi:UDPglucose--hexose-1-phosphate uridylyltransferase
MVRTVPNKFPVLSSDGFLQKEGYGIYDQMTGIGAHEVLIETPDHDKTLTDLSKEEMQAVISQSRILALLPELPLSIPIARSLLCPWSLRPCWKN